MSPRVQFAYNALWMAHPVLQLCVAGVMFRRKLHRTFKVFFIYLLSQVVIFATVYPIYRSGNYELFFYTYWVCIGISVVIGFKVIHEIFLDVFKPYHALKDLGSVLFKWAGLVMLLVAIVVAAASPATEQGPLVQAVLTVQRCIRVTQVGLIMFLLIFSKYLGVSRKQHSFGIALGFGTFAIIELLLIALRAAAYMGENDVSIANMAAYNCGILIWLVFTLSKSPSRDEPSTLLTSQRWDRSLIDLQQPTSADSLIPMFEGMVDRAFSRTNGGEGSPTENVAEELAALRQSSSIEVRTRLKLPTKT